MHDGPPNTPSSTPSPEHPLVREVREGYAIEGRGLELGALMLDEETQTDVAVRVPLGMLNRHGLITGATGTGKTRTLQLMAEQLSAFGVPVFAPDVKGDLSGLGAPGEADDKLVARARAVGQQWVPASYPVEFYALGGHGPGVPLRATISSFGPVLLAKILGLNDTQESSLGLIFHYADEAGLPLVDLSDLRAVVHHLVSDEGKPELDRLGGLARSTAGVILRELVHFADQGADDFFGEPELETGDLVRTAPDGRGVITLVELPDLQDRPVVFSTFLVWLLAELFHDLPEVGDPPQPSLVFFFDEAHLLFRDATREFLDAVARTVRLIRSKGVGVFFVTQSPTDLPDEVLAQLGSRVQHQLRAHTPDEAKALRATVDTFPTSGYDDLGEVLTTLGTGEAVVTVMDERGAPAPVAWTRLRAPESRMGPAAPESVRATFGASKMQGKYGARVERESAREMLALRLEQGARKARAEREAAERVRSEEEFLRSRPDGSPRKHAPSGTRSRNTAHESVVVEAVQSPAAKRLMRVAAREIARGLFRVGRR